MAACSKNGGKRCMRILLRRWRGYRLSSWRSRWSAWRTMPSGAQLWDKAVVYCRQAGAKARAHSAHHQAVTHWEQALEALKHLPATRDMQEQAIDLRFSLRDVLNFLGDNDRIFSLPARGRSSGRRHSRPAASGTGLQESDQSF